MSFFSCFVECLCVFVCVRALLHVCVPVRKQCPSHILMRALVWMPEAWCTGSSISMCPVLSNETSLGVKYNPSLTQGPLWCYWKPVKPLMGATLCPCVMCELLSFPSLWGCSYWFVVFWVNSDFNHAHIHWADLSWVTNSSVRVCVVVVVVVGASVCVHDGHTEHTFTICLCFALTQEHFLTFSHCSFDHL